jgi:hypothetical protein
LPADSSRTTAAADRSGASDECNFDRFVGAAPPEHVGRNVPFRSPSGSPPLPRRQISVPRERPRMRAAAPIARIGAAASSFSAS